MTVSVGKYGTLPLGPQCKLCKTFFSKEKQDSFINGRQCGRVTQVIGQKHSTPFTQTMSVFQQFKELVHRAQENASREIPPIYVGLLYYGVILKLRRTRALTIHKYQSN